MRSASKSLVLFSSLTVAALSCGEGTKPNTTPGGTGGKVTTGTGGTTATGTGGTTPGTGSGGTPGGSGGTGGTTPGGSGGTGGTTPGGGSGTDGAVPPAPDAGGVPDTGPTASCPAGAMPMLVQTTVTGMVTFPISLVGHPSDPATAYILERRGQVRVMKNGAVAAQPIATLTGVATDNERGALSLALHPKFNENGRMFIFYTAPATTIEEWKVADPANPTAATKTKSLYSFPHSGGYHQGGQVNFGPDGMLYISVGENHMSGNATATDGRLGRIMRIDPDTGMPPATGNLSGFTWSYGLRNPYRTSFDRLTGDFYIADVGQDTQEEIDFEPKGQGGKNYGWPGAEGMLGQGGVRPVHSYTRAGGNCVIGGYVYRGTKFPCLQGRYFYGDHGSNQVRSFVIKNGMATDHQSHPSLSGNAGGALASFGEDGAGELYILRAGGRVSRIEVQAQP